MCDLHTNTLPSQRRAPPPAPPPPIKTQQNIISLSVRQSDRVDQTSRPSVVQQTRPSVGPLPPSYLEMSSQEPPSLGGPQYYHPTSLTSQTPTVTSPPGLGYAQPNATFHSTSTLLLHPPQFLQNNTFFMQNLIYPILAAPGCPKIFVWLNQVRADFHHNNSKTARDKRSTPLFWVILKCPSQCPGVIPGWNQAKLQHRAGHISNAAKWKPRKCSRQWCIFDAVHLFSLNPCPVTLMVTSGASF